MPTLNGKVVLEGGGAASLAVVEVHNSRGDVVDQVQTDKQGGFKYHLSPGAWTLRVWDPQGFRGGAQILIGDDEDPSTLEIVLDRSWIRP